MDFGFTAEQEMLRDAARKFLAAECPPAVARAAMKSPRARDRALWQKLAGLGWTGILVPEEFGGMGGTFLDMAVVLEESGKALLPAPLLASATLAVVAVRTAASPEQRARILPALARGEYALAVAVDDHAADGTTLTRDAGHPSDGTTLTTNAASSRIDGSAGFVLDADVVDAVVIAARAPDADRPRLVLVERGAPGVLVAPLQTVDMTRRLCTIELRDAPCTPLGDGAADASARRRIVEHAHAALALELVGVGQRALEMAVAYANERTQFGRPIGSFQAIKHKCVDMMVAVETARSLAYYAAWAVSEDAPDAARAAAMAKAYSGDMAKTVTSEAIQVHGGVGFTWEHDLHLYYRRALAADAAFGAAPTHRETIVRALVD
jgi:alkylation response protein AidB-like acyl-CoA dehydrogenase